MEVILKLQNRSFQGKVLNYIRSLDNADSAKESLEDRLLLLKFENQNRDQSVAKVAINYEESRQFG